MTRHYCDRCGSEIPNGSPYGLTLWTGDRKELCGTCMSELAKWLGDDGST